MIHTLSSSSCSLRGTWGPSTTMRLLPSSSSSSSSTSVPSACFSFTFSFSFSLSSMGCYAHGCAPNAVDRDDGGALERTNDNGEEEDGAALLKVCERDPSGGDREGREMVRSLQESRPGGRGSGARCAHHHSLCKCLCWGFREPTVTLHRSLRFGMVVSVVGMNFPVAFVSSLPCRSMFSLSCLCFWVEK